MTWNKALDAVLSDWDGKNVVVSPDVDGILSAALVSQATDAKVVGAYTTSNLLLFDGATRAVAKDALWVDIDVNNPGVRCIGQHMVNHQPGDSLAHRDPCSFNPNVFFGQSWRDSFKGKNKTNRDKFPLGTTHFLLAHLGGAEPVVGTPAFTLVAHADGTWGVAHGYQNNGRHWRDLMLQKSALVDELVEGRYTPDATNLKLHRKAVADLLALGVEKRRSQEKENPFMPPAWVSLQGNQTVPFRKGGSTEKFTQSLAGLIAYVGKTTGWTLAAPGHVSEAIHCPAETFFPNQIKAGQFDAWLTQNKVFSHAFTSFRELRWTPGPVL